MLQVQNIGLGLIDLVVIIFSRIVYGAQTSLFIGLGAVACAILFGSILGSTAATSEKWGNEIIMRLMDTFNGFPRYRISGSVISKPLVTLCLLLSSPLLWFILRNLLV